jgi:hypothetical protein
MFSMWEKVSGAIMMNAQRLAPPRPAQAGNVHGLGGAVSR